MTGHRVGDDVTVQHFDVFPGSPRGGGNPCPVVLDAEGLSAVQMQTIAAHYGQESGFVVGADAGGVRLRYFVPQHEMRMCVHATVAIIAGLVAEGGLDGGAIVVHTASGDCPVTWTEHAPTRVTVEQQAPRLEDPGNVGSEVAYTLGLPHNALSDALPIRSVSVSRAKLIVPLRQASDVYQADPRLVQLWDLCRRLNTTGAYLFAPHPDGRPDHVVARQFPVAAGYPEDPATGVAAGALAAYLADRNRPSPPCWVNVEIDQGDTMGRPSTLHASAFADAVGVHRSTVTGHATHRSTERLDLAAVVNQHPDITTDLC
ncbi:MAG: PhzF family phenazine biosynthesis protein [Acidimicrobiales bacterium]